MRVLDEILRVKREEIARLAGRPVRAKAEPRGALVCERLERSRGRLNLIAEIKRKSPSAGALSLSLSVAERARIYSQGGVAMISVLCDEQFFAGSFDHLAEARAAQDTLLLAKEFVLDARQIEEAAACGADAVLLIVRIAKASIRDLVRAARDSGLEPLVEIVTEDELAIAIDADARVIGVNARDLDTLEMDPARTARVLAAIPADRIAVHLSGIKAPADVARIAQVENVDAALLGEALMREDDPTDLLARLVAASFG